jgi:hypothetical protein
LLLVDQRGSGSTVSTAIPVEPEPGQTDQWSLPEIRRFDTGHQQSFKPFDPDTSLAGTLVEVGPRHVLGQ